MVGGRRNRTHYVNQPTNQRTNEGPSWWSTVAPIHRLGGACGLDQAGALGDAKQANADEQPTIGPAGWGGAEPNRTERIHAQHACAPTRAPTSAPMQISNGLSIGVRPQQLSMCFGSNDARPAKAWRRSVMMSRGTRTCRGSTYERIDTTCTRTHRESMFVIGCSRRLCWCVQEERPGWVGGG